MRQILIQHSVFDIGNDGVPGQIRSALIFQTVQTVIIGGEKDQPVLFHPRLLTTFKQDHLGGFECLVSTATAAICRECRRLQYHQTRTIAVFIRHIAGRGENMDPGKAMLGTKARSH